MNSKEYRQFLESYNGIYEQIGVKVPASASDSKALKGLIPKGDKVHEIPSKKSTLQNASYEPEGEMIGEQESANESVEEVQTDLFDYILEYLVAEGFADTNDNALAIMTSMSEEWKQSIIEAGFPPVKGNMGGPNPIDPVTGKSKYKVINGKEVENPGYKSGKLKEA